VTTALAAILALTLPGGVPQADSPTPAPSVTIGSRARVTTGGTVRPTIGTVVSIGPDALVLKADGRDGLWAVARANIRRLEVSGGSRSRWADGALIGAGIGAMPGVLLTFGDIDSDVHGDGPSPVAVAAMGAVGGALVGAAIGRAIKAERWLGCDVPRASVAVWPVRHGAAVSVRIAWGGDQQQLQAERGRRPSKRQPFRGWMGWPADWRPRGSGSE